MRNKPAAVKVFKSNIIKRKIIQMSAKLRGLKHSNIVHFRGYSIRPSAIFFELCSLQMGEDIVHNLSQMTTVLNSMEHFVLNERLGYLNQALSGLNYLHARNIIHQDFKPSNLLVQGNSVSDVTIKLTDFDEILMVKQTITATTTGNHLKGMTLAYASPELCQCLVKKPTKESDIYSFAITCFETVINGSSAWLGVLPLLNDTILINALLQGKRPSLEIIHDIYSVTKQSSLVCQIIRESWQDDYLKRPSSNEVNILHKISC